ncbi:MAG: flippase-like domain-containing protein [Thermomicrobiales bacterium]
MSENTKRPTQPSDAPLDHSSEPAASRRSVGQTVASGASALFHRLRSVDGVVWGVLLLILVGWFVWTQWGEVERTGRVLRAANGWWLLAMTLAALALHLTFALTQSSLLKALGHRIPLWPSITTYVERQTVATVVPFGQAPSFVLLVKRFARFGVTQDDAIYSGILYSIIGYASFALFLLPIMVWLGFSGRVTQAILVAAIILIVVVLLLATGGIQILRGKRLPARIERRIPERVHDFVQTARTHRLSFWHVVPSFLWAFLGDALGVLTLYLALRAVGNDPSIGVAVAGYTIGTLFMLVAPLFMGLGVVELSMTLLLQQLGVPPAHALGATLLYRVADVWLPVVLGVAVQGRTQRTVSGLPARLPAIWTGFSGVVSILSVMPHPVHHTLRPHGGEAEFATFTLINASRAITLGGGFLLILLSYGLWRRRRIAWIIAVVLTAFVIGTHLGKSHDHLATGVAIVNLGVLLIYNNRFTVRSDPPTVRRGLIVSATMLIAALGYGVFSLWVLDKPQFGVDFSFRGAIVQSLQLYFGRDSAGLVPHTSYAHWLVDSFHLIGVLTVGVLAYSLARPYVWRHRVIPADRARARDLVMQYGDSSEDVFKYWHDKSFFFDIRGDAVIGYGVSSGVALVLGDPVAANDDAFDRILRDFLDYCDLNGWNPAFHHATPQRLDAYRQAGLVSLRIGAEAVVEVDTFSIAGNQGKSFRNVLNRIRREGWSLVEWAPPQSEERMRELREVSDEWLTLEGRRERGFTLGAFEDAYIRDSTVLAVQHEDGRVAAFVNLIHDGVPGELTFDLMRHRVDAPNGAMDFVMLSMIEYARAHGYHALSLGMVPFADTPADEDSGVRQHALSLLTRNFDRIFAATTLFAYKDKFRPRWDPRYLVYKSDAALPAIGLAIARLGERPFVHETEVGETDEPAFDPAASSTMPTDADISQADEDAAARPSPSAQVPGAAR